MKRTQLIFTMQDTFASRAIRWITWSKYSHVALLVDDGLMSIGAEFRGGVVLRKTSELQAHASRWAIVELAGISAIETERRMRGLIGLPYDVFAILGFMFRMGKWNNPKRWFCSEAVAYACSHTLQIVRKKHSRVSPQDLWQVSNAVVIASQVNK